MATRSKKIQGGWLLWQIKINSGLHVAGTRCKFRLTYETLNSRIINMEYAVRGKIPQEAKRIEAQLRKVQCLLWFFNVEKKTKTQFMSIVNNYCPGISWIVQDKCPGVQGMGKISGNTKSKFINPRFVCESCSSCSVCLLPR